MHPTTLRECPRRICHNSSHRPPQMLSFAGVNSHSHRADCEHAAEGARRLASQILRVMSSRNRKETIDQGRRKRKGKTYKYLLSNLSRVDLLSSSPSDIIKYHQVPITTTQPSIKQTPLPPLRIVAHHIQQPPSVNNTSPTPLENHTAQGHEQHVEHPGHEREQARRSIQRQQHRA